jgi:hypothetical protein
MVQSQSSRFVEWVRGELPKLCREKRTGMVFIASSDNRLAQFGLDQGEIVFLAFQNKRGLEALSSLQTQDFKIGVFRFIEGQASPSRPTLPATDDILKQLAGGEHQRSTVPAEPVSARTLSDNVKAVLVQELTECIGPMAAIVCEETWGSVSTLAQALDALGQELPDVNQAARFQQNVLKRLVL